MASLTPHRLGRRVGILQDRRTVRPRRHILFLWWAADIAHIIMGKYTDKEGRPIIDWV
jgi:hypothetical protein